MERAERRLRSTPARANMGYGVVRAMTDTDTAPAHFGTETDAHGSAIGESRPVPFATRPVLQGRLGMVAAGHYLAAAIGLSLLEKGGNAIDAGVAAGFALALLKPQSVGIGGESPILVHMARTGKTQAINGQGWA